MSNELNGYESIPIEEFDKLARDRQFTDGPFITTFGDTWHDPYVPDREVHGVLSDGRKVKSRKGV